MIDSFERFLQGTRLRCGVGRHGSDESISGFEWRVKGKMDRTKHRMFSQRSEKVDDETFGKSIVPSEIDFAREQNKAVQRHVDDTALITIEHRRTLTAPHRKTATL